MSENKTYIVNDQPTEKDALDFTPYVETLADIIQTGNTPLTIGVFGGWGSGKTSLMRMVQNGIPDSAYEGLPEDYTIVWFDAWKYDKEETLWRAFLLAVLFAIRETAKKQNKPLGALDYLETMLYRDIELEKVGGVTIDLAKLGGKVAQGVVQIGLSFIPGVSALTKLIEDLQKSAAANMTDEVVDAIHRERTKIHIEQVRFLEQFQDKFKILIQQFIAPNRLVVFVDDLDRCLPEKAIQVLEAIKLFLDVQDCVFVLGIDQDVIARGIEMKYKDVKDKKDTDGKPYFTIEGIKYLEKIIQLPFQIPPVIQDDMGTFVEGLSDEWPHEECHRVFAEGLGNNPRQIKRTVNTFLMLSKLAEKRKEKIKGQVKPIRLAKVVAIQAAQPDLFNLLLKEEPRYLRLLEEYYRAELPERDASDEEKNNIALTSRYITDDGETSALREASTQRVEPPPALVPFLSQRGNAAVRKILTMKHSPDTQDAGFVGLPTDELRVYFTLTRSAEAPQAAPTKTEAERFVFEPQVVRIPAGKFLMGSTPEQAKQSIDAGAYKDWVEGEQPQHTVELSEYSIGKYPITNREYQAFVRDAKYNPPRGWDGDQFPDEKGSHPVVSVSWDDANEYCKWLSVKTKKNYRLPTEAEWEKAARGEDGRVYPWGNEFDLKKANTKEASVGDTSEVGNFSPQGDSPYGCVDMAGNVFEWCHDWFDENEYKNRADSSVKDPQGPKKGERRSLRGGSWDDFENYARVSVRRGYRPSLRDLSYGFRVVVFPSR